ncbi:MULTISPECIES: hypothetical protein [Rhizobium]|uniref:Uncharacterized protein n=1 Tax=Rhizobium lentis TaxID=1138194 RepID=A0ABS7IAT4_9HYPH|nr:MULTISPECIES: hypothetical protein [Rhizobium]MBB3350112.1 hypothetical protein [Rhizobium sp. BK049]MBX4910102.1 hypothetical protein [Rhizobium bangladeshense]MBX5010301.1 hypothetical protein [Rhizobium lentis]MBX5087666.1 hypothetical protein [Rhizobium lentis]MBX5101594.1 hypothetical protein [Rhizobium lentis]
MPEAPNEFAASPNGDKWYLEHNETADQHTVIHRANDASGGTVTRWPISSFLEHFGDHPQGQALREALHDAGSAEQEVPSEHTPVVQKLVTSFPWSRKTQHVED